MSPDSKEKFIPPKVQPKSEQTKNAFEILVRSYESAGALLKGYYLFREKRAGPRRGGISTDAEQDLLRAMLVMASAGLDATVKRLIRDSLHLLVALSVVNSPIRGELEKFIARRIKSQEDTPGVLTGHKFLARVLVSSWTQEAATEDYILDLVGSSLQSDQEVLKVFKALGVPEDDLDQAKLRTIFDVRNKIIHELDVDLDKPGRKRIHRGVDKMVGYSSYLLSMALNLVTHVDTQLAAAKPRHIMF